MNKIDLVYILGSGSRWHDNELRYSLRSVERYLPEARILIFGERPEWLTGVIHVSMRDSYPNKLANARSKYKAIATSPIVASDFVLMNDDFFFLKPVEEIKYYSRGKMKDLIARHPTQGGYYFRSLQDTRNKLVGMGLEEPDDFEIHSPIIFNKEKLLTTMGIMGEEKAYSLRSCYGNLNNIEPEETIDFKAANLTELAFQIKRDAEYLSISDALVAAPEFREWIERKFHKPSKYELDKGAGASDLLGRSGTKMEYHAVKDFMFEGKQYNTGQIIHKEVGMKLRGNSKLSHLWKLS